MPSKLTVCWFQVSVGNLSPMQVRHGTEHFAHNPQELLVGERRSLVVARQVSAPTILEDHEHHRVATFG